MSIMLDNVPDYISGVCVLLFQSELNLSVNHEHLSKLLTFVHSYVLILGLDLLDELKVLKQRRSVPVMVQKEFGPYAFLYYIASFTAVERK